MKIWYENTVVLSCKHLADFWMILKTLEYKIFKNDQSDVLFSTGSCALYQPDPISLSILDILTHNGAVNREKLITTLDSSYAEEEIAAALNELEQAGLIRSFEKEDTGNDSPPPMPLANLPGVSHLVMNVSHACNLKCSYCYADGGSYSGETELMSPDMAAASAEFLLENTTDRDVMITFFGGEPLLNVQAIRTAVSRGRERAKKLGKNIGFAITTNGTLRDEDFLSFAASNGVKFTISIDGSRNSHDRHRKFNDGTGSYDDILTCLPGILERVKVPARTTLTKENTDVVGITEHLLELGFSEVGFAPVDATDGELALGEAELEQVLEGFSTLSERFLENTNGSTMYGFSNIINLIKLLHEGEVKPLPCGAGLKLMGASPDGKLYLCHRFTGNKDFQIGSISEGFDDRRRREILESAFIGSKPDCMSCWARYLCGGGCHYLSHLHHGNIKDPHGLTCKFLRRWFEIGVRVYSHIAQKNPDFLERCTRMRLNC